MNNTENRNRLVSGDVIIAIPNGLHVTLRYDSNGNIEKCYSGFYSEGDHVECTDTLLDEILLNVSVPRSISVKDGYTYVEGVFMSRFRSTCPGELPGCSQSEFSQFFKEDPSEFKFKAVNAFSTNMLLKGHSAVYSWLRLNKFDVLPSCVTSSNFDWADPLMSLESVSNKETWPVVPCYAAYHRGEISYHSTHIIQGYVRDLETFIDGTGKVNSKFTIEDTDRTYIRPFTECNRLQIEEMSFVYIYDGQIIQSVIREGSKKLEKYVCPCCGRLVPIPDDGALMCSDLNCNSRLYARYNQFVSTYSLPVIPSDIFLEQAVRIGPEFSLKDVFKFPQYSDVELDTTVSKLLAALVPKSVCSSDAVELFCNECNNSIDTVEYYLNHPEQAKRDLAGNNIDVVVAVLNWFKSCPESKQDLLSMCSDSHVHVLKEMKMFDGPKIFRDKSILITGKFTHGDIEHIQSIISSYGGTAVTRNDNKYDCVVVGDLNEDVNGSYIVESRKAGIPIFSESQFFNTYSIDEDIRENL